MIFRRLAASIRKQDWFAISIEFVLLVVGVFLGIQVANWNEERQEHAQQEQIERRLRGDFQLLDEALSRAMRSHEEIILALEALRTAIERGEALSSEDEAIKTALVMGRSYPSFERKSATYSELVSSGRLHLVRSDSLRKALALYNERIDNSLYNIQQIREPMNQDLIFLAQYAELTPITAGSVGIQAALSYDIAAMANDLEFRRRLGVLIVFQTWTYSNLANQRKAIDAVLQAIEPK
ncbi:MAG: hypothetical protein R3F12_08865 [Lysobacteraceae bacterium]